MASSFIEGSLSRGARARLCGALAGLCALALAGTAAASVPASIVGVVTLSGQTDASGATLLLSGVLADGVTVVTSSKVTDPSGGYEFPDLAPGTYSLLASHAGYVSQSVRGILVAATGSTPLNFTLVALARLSGAVLLDRAVPAPAGLAVSLTGPSGPLATTTDSSGLFAFEELIPGDYTVTVTRPCAAPAAASVSLPSSSPVILRSLSNNFRLSGVVNLAGHAGADQSDTTLTLTQDGVAPSSTTATDPLGGYSFEALCAGTYTVAASRPRYEAKSVSVTLTASSVVPAIALGYAAAYRVFGTVVVSTGGDASGVLVTLDGTDLKATSAADGTFAIPGVPPGIYTLLATKAAFADVRIPDLDVAADYSLVLHLSPPAAIVKQSAKCSAVEGTAGWMPLWAVLGLWTMLRLRRRARA